MSKERIIAKIEADSKKEADAILKEAEKIAKEILEKARLDAKQECTKILADAAKECETLKQMIIAKANQNARRKILEGKEEIIEKCLEEAKKKLFELEEKKYQKVIERLIKNGCKILGKDCIVIPSRKEDVEVSKKLKMRVDTKRKTGSSRGVILVSKDGLQSIDNTFEGIFERKIDKIKTKIGRILFQEK
jgi:vacuolar-type H+-ATPase subunit E/Vma4